MDWFRTVIHQQSSAGLSKNLARLVFWPMCWLKACRDPGLHFRYSHPLVGTNLIYREMNSY